jgi:hypothetical protein
VSFLVRLFQVQLLITYQTAVHSDDNTVKPDHSLKRCLEQLEAALQKVGRPPTSGPLLKHRLEKAGFVDIKQHIYKEPVGPWPKDKRLKRAGALALLAADTGIEAYVMGGLTRVMGIDSETVRRLCEEGLRDAKNRHYHAYTHL